LSRDSAGCEARNRRPRLWRITLRVQRDGRHFTVDVVPDGDGLVSHAGAALLAEAADRLGLTAALSRALAPMRERRSRHDPGRVVRDLVVMLADGGDCLADLRAVRDQQPLFGAVASDATAFRVIDAIAADPDPEPLARELRAEARILQRLGHLSHRTGQLAEPHAAGEQIAPRIVESGTAARSQDQLGAGFCAAGGG
jgi:hypothetical protein